MLSLRLSNGGTPVGSPKSEDGLGTLMVFLGGPALASCCGEGATEVEGRLTVGQEFDLLLFFSVSSGFCAKILL